MKAAASLLALALGGCVHAPPPPVVVCLPLKPYTAGLQQQLDAELGALGADVVAIPAFIADYIQMRDEDRACLATAKP